MTGWTDVHIEVVAVNSYGEPELWKIRFGLPPTVHYFKDIDQLLIEVKEIYHVQSSLGSVKE